MYIYINEMSRWGFKTHSRTSMCCVLRFFQTHFTLLSIFLFFCVPPLFSKWPSPPVFVAYVFYVVTPLCHPSVGRFPFLLFAAYWTWPAAVSCPTTYCLYASLVKHILAIGSLPCAVPGPRSGYHVRANGPVTLANARLSFNGLWRTTYRCAFTLWRWGRIIAGT